MTPHEFTAKWQRANLSERSACQQHFLDLCALLGQPTPATTDPDGAWYTFERGVRKTSGGQGWADVWMRGRFGWEYKKKRRNLDEAYQQLLLYREALENPPLLVACDLDRFEIHTNFTGTVDGPWSRYVHKPNARGIGTVRYPRLVPCDADAAKELKKRTLTNLYNQRPTWLDLAHRRLDEAVFAAYGWDPAISDEELLGNLLEVNLARAGTPGE